MKYELIKKILNSPITVLDYLILEHVMNDTLKEFVQDEKFISQITFLKAQEYISDNFKITVKGKEVMDKINLSQQTDFYSILHKSLQDKLLHLTNKKQKILQGKYSFLPNETDLKVRLQKLIKKYNLTDLNKIKKVLLLYVEKSNKAKFEYVQTIEYYLLKNDISNFVTDYENYSVEEQVEQDYDGINI